MKKLCTAVAFSIAAQNIFAMPNFDKSVGFSAPMQISILRDTEDPHNFYLFPQRFGVARDEIKKLKFYGQQYYDEQHNLRAFIEVTFTPYFDKDSVLAAIKEIKRNDPNSRFSLVSIIGTELEVPKILFPGIEKLDCQTIGGFLGQDVNCRIEVNTLGVNLFFQRVSQNFLVLFNNTYSFNALSANEIKEIHHTIPMYAGKIPMSYVYKPNGGPLTKPKDDQQEDLGATLEEIQEEISKMADEMTQHAPSVVNIDEILKKFNRYRGNITPTGEPWIVSNPCGINALCANPNRYEIRQPLPEVFERFRK